MNMLENDQLKVAIHSKGAELQSLISKHSNTEFMWSGDSRYWGKYSPILFPIVGGLKNDTYYYRNKAYNLPRHGFARDMIFDVESKSEEQIVFCLKYNEDTLLKYPFKFELKILYTLYDNKLSCTYKVKNMGDDEMLFSIGAHPAFAVPNHVNSVYEDYYLQFNNDAQLERYKLDNGLISQHTAIINLDNNKLPLQHQLFYEDAIVLKTLQSDCIFLKSSRNDHILSFNFSQFPYFGIWAAKDAPFVCLEPWCGIADNTQHNQQLSEKEGINILAPQNVFERTWSVSIVS